MLFLRSSVLCLLVLSGCATGAAITTVPYTLQPARSANPAQEVKELILANTVQGCVTEPVVTDKMMTVKFVCSSGVGNGVIRFDRVAKIELEQSGEWYRVMVRHTAGTEDFSWSSKSLEDMQRMADAIAALSTPSPAVPVTDTTKI
jgi:hypothetical protein